MRTAAPSRSTRQGSSRTRGAALLNAAGHLVASQRVDALGGLLYRQVRPGRGYRIRLAGGAESAPVTVHSDAAAPWDPGIYKQKIADHGYQYLTTRDGTKLAIYVHPPSHPAGISSLPNGISLPNSYSQPPYPTVIEYSGYGYADPAGPDSGIAVLANLMGFAVVDVNMRGTGCSGGSYDYFEPLQNLDGYDVIQTIAHQPWVLGHKVGMIGVSYGAISQLFTAQLDPPALEAISPLSTIDSTITTLYPGGILNTGFAVSWAAQRQQNAEPAGPSAGQPWAYTRIEHGDETCKRNQALHGEAPSLIAKVRRNAHYIPAMADPLDPITFVHKIKAAVFMACQWEDEQTGGHCADLAEDFTGTHHKWFTFTNGAHIDSLDPATFDRWYDFLSLFVAHRAPATNSGLVQFAAPLFYGESMGISNATLPPDPIQQIPTYRAALAAYEKLPEVRVLFDNGAGAGPDGRRPGWLPLPGIRALVRALPDPGHRRPDLVSRGRWLAGHQPRRSARGRHVHLEPEGTTRDRLRLREHLGGGLWGDAPDWDWNWQQNPPGTAVSYVSAPLTQNTTVIGGGAVHVWIKASTPSVDLQATVSEVRPDGMETFVQDGWVRADERRLARAAARLLRAGARTCARAPCSRCQPGSFVEVTIPLYYEGHVYRAGSRIRRHDLGARRHAAAVGVRPDEPVRHRQRLS